MSKIIEDQINALTSGAPPTPSDVDVLVQIAKAEAWAECVAWFASEPQRLIGRDHRVRISVLLEAEQCNPYEGVVPERS